MSARVALIAIALAACESQPRTYDRQAAAGVFSEVVLAGSPDGLSGLAVDDGGVLWVVPERDRQILSIALPPALPPRIMRYPLAGLAEDLETEGLAWLDRDHLALAVEGQHGPRAAVAFAERRGDRFVVTHTQSLEQLDLGVRVTTNHGAEAVCGTGADLVVAIEATGRFPDGGRFAPIVRIAEGAMTVMRLRLTTETGKIAGMDCAIASDGSARVWAIERHYGVSRIVRFVVPRDAAAHAELALDVVLDLAPILRDSLNLEGIVRLPDGRLVVVADNQGKSVAGPSRLLVFAPIAGTH